MVLKAHLGPELPVDAESGGYRGAPRRELLLETSGSLQDGEEANVTVQNVSETGMLFESDIDLHQGDTLQVELPHAGPVIAEVVWVSGSLFGCAFAKRLSPATLSATQLRADRPIPLAAPGETLGIKLNRLRRERGLTLAQVAEFLQVSKPTVWAWEKGKAKPVADRYEAIAEVLQVSVGELTDVSPSSAAQSVIEDSRLRIAATCGVRPENVRIMLDL